MEKEEELEVRGYRRSHWRLFVCCVCTVLTGGLIWLVTSRRKSWLLKLTHSSCPLKEADKVLIVDANGQQFLSTVHRKTSLKPQTSFFYCKRLKYTWNEKASKFEHIRGLDVATCAELRGFAGGLNSEEVEKRLGMYGPNSIDIKVKPILALIFREIQNPFYFYQACCVVIWCCQLYYMFAVAMVLLSVISVSATVWETRKQSRSLRDAMQFKSEVTVIRNGKKFQIESEKLVPGDVMVISQSPITLTCDAIILCGTCVVNESMLTGESTPITKVPLSEDTGSVLDAQHKKSFLSCGTEVLLSRSMDELGVRAIVYRTGFSTTKGELVRSILYPKSVKLSLYSDFLKCGLIFFTLGIPALIYTCLVGMKLGAYPADILLFSLNVITFFFPPALPAVLTSINQQAQRRLRKKDIYCLDTSRIHIAGGLDVVCFDKTGTLTEENLDILAAVPVQDGKFEKEVENLEQIPSNTFIKAMASCHSLSIIDGKLLGHDLDIKMINSIGWELQEPSSEDILPFDFRPPRIVSPKFSQEHHKPPSVAILKQFPFESSHRRMGVVTQTEGESSFQAFVKGAPELVITLCSEETVPHNAKEIIDQYSSRGFRIIGLAAKYLKDCTSVNHVMAINRKDFEVDLQFLGLIVLENKLKDETIPALNTLKEANIRSVIVTGDNLLTAITVGRKCGIVDETDSLVKIETNLVSESKHELANVKLEVSYRCVEPHLSYKECLQEISLDNKKNSIVHIGVEDSCRVALDGSTFNLLRTYAMDILEKVIVKGAIFARMLPEDKLLLIEHFQSLGYQVGMCGDGANDCGALKIAHTGVSLSMAEASVAAPFTSTNADIRCVPNLIREGRATLVSTFDAFKYMMCYTFTFLIGVIFLFWDGQRPSDGAYLTIDMILNMAPPFLMGATTAFSALAKNPPPRSILSFIPMFSIFSFLTLQIGMHLISLSYCRAQSWYEPFKFNIEDPHTPKPSYSGTTLLSVNMMAYVTAAVAFPTGKPYRNGLFSNKKYLGVIVIEILLIACIILYPPEFMISFLNFKQAPFLPYHLILYAISLGGFLFFFIYEKYFVQSLLPQYILPIMKKRSDPVKRYEKLQEELREWPPLNDHTSQEIGSSTNGSYKKTAAQL